MPGSAFDNLQNTVFQQVNNLFGFDASWTSVDGTTSWQGKVLFKQPTEQYAPGTFQYDPFKYEMEYKAGDLVGLLERVESRGVPETVVIDGNSYHVRDVTADWDGKTYRATLSPVQDI